MSQDHDSLALRKRRLLRGEITYAAAKEQDANILHQLGYRDQKIRYFTHLYRNRKLIEEPSPIISASVPRMHVVLLMWRTGSMAASTSASELMLMAKDEIPGDN